MVISSYAKNAALTLTIMCAIYGCRSGQRGNKAPPQGRELNRTEKNVPQAPDEAPSGSLLTDEPASMAREDQQRSEQSLPQTPPPKKSHRPEPPLRPVTR